MKLRRQPLCALLVAIATFLRCLGRSTQTHDVMRVHSGSKIRTRGLRWWNLGRNSEQIPHESNSITAPFYTNPSLQILTRKQKRLVTKHPGTMAAVAKGAAIAIEECKFQFQYRKWNCPIIDDSHGGSVFGKILRRGCRETAFIYAITSAGLYHAVARACSEGSINTCSCGTRFPSKAREHEEGMVGDWRWGGCSDNAEFGHKFTRDFIDGVEKGRDLRNVVNLHNAGAGRMNIMNNFIPECKCHGISGSCNIKTCWMRLKGFRTVGDQLKDRFIGASKVQQANSGYNRVKPRDIRTLMVPVDKHHKIPDPYDLVYFENSPSFCDKDSSVSFRGTTGRECNVSSIGVDGCDLMCCGRGYKTEKYSVRERCNCVFHWCCKVTCDVCKRTRLRHTCK